MRRHRETLAIAAACVVGLAASSARAIITTEGDGRITTPPPAPYLDAWNLQGQLGPFLATPIDDRHVLAAAHIGTPQNFSFQGHDYTLQSNYTDVPGSDLRVWTLDTSSDPTLFSSWAPLWNPATDGSEVGHELVVFGRGVTRGQAIYAPINPGPGLTPNQSVGGASVVPTSGVLTSAAASATSGSTSKSGPTATVPSELRGWTLGSYDGVQSWGRNVVDSIYDDPKLGKFLFYDFDRTDSPDAVTHEGELSPYDSSGGVFIQSGGVWKLAGVNFGVDGIYAATPDGVYSPVWGDGYTRAAIVDIRGLYTITDDGPDPDTNPDVVQIGYGNDPTSGLLPITSDLPVGAGSYSTEVGAYTAYILSQIGAQPNSVGSVGVLAPEPASVGLLSSAALVVARRRRVTR